MPKHTLRKFENDETLLSYQIQRLAPHFSEVLLLSGSYGLVPASVAKIVPDPRQYQGQGPLAALLAALQVASTEWVGLLAIDQPMIPPTLYRRALGHMTTGGQAVIFLDQDGKPQWLCGLYHRTLVSPLENELRRGVRSMHQFWSSRAPLFLSSPDPAIFQNLNTPEQARAAGWALPD